MGIKDETQIPLWVMKKKNIDSTSHRHKNTMFLNTLSSVVLRLSCCCAYGAHIHELPSSLQSILLLLVVAGKHFWT